MPSAELRGGTNGNHGGGGGGGDVKGGFFGSSYAHISGVGETGH